MTGMSSTAVGEYGREVRNLLPPDLGYQPKISWIEILMLGEDAIKYSKVYKRYVDSMSEE